MESKNDENLVKESQKVAKFYFGADEAVVATLPKRVGVTPLQAKGFT